jgi:hypothetical protein
MSPSRQHSQRSDSARIDVLDNSFQKFNSAGKTFPKSHSRFCCIKGTGVFAEIGSSWVPYTTFPAVPILASNSRRYSYSKTTPRITDTESRLMNFFKENSVWMIRRVINSPHQWYSESPTPRITDTESRQLCVSLSRGVYDSADRGVAIQRKN